MNTSNHRVLAENNEKLLDIVTQLEIIREELTKEGLENLISQIKNIIISLNQIINKNNNILDIKNNEISHLDQDFIAKFENLNINSNKIENSLIIHALNDKGWVYSHPHLLKYSNYKQKPPEYLKGRWICNECNNKFEYDIPNFFCNSCLYDICDSCYEEKKKLANYKIGDKKIISNHPHTLLYCDYSKKSELYRYGDWICNECNDKYSSQYPNFYCNLCLYDICDKCVKKFK